MTGHKHRTSYIVAIHSSFFLVPLFFQYFPFPCVLFVILTFPFFICATNLALLETITCQVDKVYILYCTTTTAKRGFKSGSKTQSKF